MTETQNRVTACLNSALQSFNQNEQYLISRDLSERCICAKFASYLERAIAESEFCEYVVDVEYNRGSRGNEHNGAVISSASANRIRTCLRAAARRRIRNDNLLTPGERAVCSLSFFCYCFQFPVSFRIFSTSTVSTSSGNA